MTKYKAIIFDMDGVLFDTEFFYYHRRKRFLKGKGISIEHLPMNFFIGGNMKLLWPAVLKEEFDQWDIEELQLEYGDYKKSYPLPYKDLLFSDTVQTIKSLNYCGYKLALASNSTKGDIDKALDESLLKDYFSVILSGQDFQRSKPDPSVYEEAVRQLGIDKSEILVVEDSEKGIEAGIRANLDVWAVKDLIFNMNQSKAARLIKNLEELTRLLSNDLK